jgi:hypothetical protein
MPLWTTILVLIIAFSTTVLAVARLKKTSTIQH